jgi:N-acetylmuramoyl-L-alanine amidase
VVGSQTRAKLANPSPVTPRSTRPGFHVEVDLDRQVMLFVEDRRVSGIYDVSTGSGQTYQSGGETHIAATPTGSFEIERTIDGWRYAPLGDLYRPAYFSGGYAIHGSPSVPPYPASHGCVRVTIHVMDLIFDRLEIGTFVDVR